MSGLTFQCFSPNGTGLYVDESSVGTLTVNELRDNDVHDTNISDELSGNVSDCIIKDINLALQLAVHVPYSLR